MIKLGYKLMSEEHGPTDLVRNANRAEQAGFDFAAISDHFFPWVEEQGHSPLAWSVLGALANATRHIGLMTAVTCPIMRYHPAIIAQGTATLGLLSDNRFTLGLGAGERLNEHVVGEGWPGRGERHERLAEAVDIIQGLLAGTLTNYRGNYFKLDDARLFDRPDVKPPVVIAAGGPKAARLAGRKGRWPDRHRAASRSNRGLRLSRRLRATLCRGGDVLCRARGGRPENGTSLFPLVSHRLAGDGGAARHRQFRSGKQARIARDGRPTRKLRPVTRSSSRSDQPLRPSWLRSHYLGPNRPGSGRISRVLRA